MLSNNHVQIVMGVIALANEPRKSKGKKFLSNDEMLAVEKKIISYVNRYNKIENFIVNNKVSIFIKELFYLVKVPYPEFLYNDATGEYVVRYSQGLSDQYLHILGVKTPFRLVMGELSTTQDVKWAIDISNYNVFKKKYMMWAINKTFRQVGGEGNFRTKRILTYT